MTSLDKALYDFAHATGSVVVVGYSPHGSGHWFAQATRGEERSPQFEAEGTAAAVVAMRAYILAAHKENALKAIAERERLAVIIEAIEAHP